MVVVTAAAAQSFIRLLTIRSLESKHGDRITTHAIFGCLATFPGLHVWCKPRTPTCGRLLSAFTVLVVLNGVGGGIYATKLLDEPVEVHLEIPDVSHATMHVASTIAAWIFQQGLLSVSLGEESTGGLSVRR